MGKEGRKAWWEALPGDHDGGTKNGPRKEGSSRPVGEEKAMIRMSPQQFALFKKPRKAGKPAVKRKPNKRKEEMGENIIEGQILSFLRARAWIVTRQQVGLFVPAWAVLDKKRVAKTSRAGLYVRIGVRGDPDWRAERPICGKLSSGIIQHFYFECKAAGQEPSLDQQARMRQLWAAGFLVEWFDSLETFQEWYERRF